MALSAETWVEAAFSEPPTPQAEDRMLKPSQDTDMQAFSAEHVGMRRV